MFRILQELARDRRGATAIEYGLLLLVMAVGIMGSLSGFADASTTMWNDVRDKSQEAIDKAN